MSIQEQVLEILKECPTARSSDEELVKIFTGRFCKFCIDLEEMGFSVKMIKNILRARRKVQENNVDLRACEKVQSDRSFLEANFRKEKGDYEI